MDGSAALVQRQRGNVRCLLLRDDPVPDGGATAPHLKCILPWEGEADLYRDGSYHGGIFHQGWWAIYYTHIVGRQLLESPRDIDATKFSYNMLYQIMSTGWMAPSGANGPFLR